MIEKKMRRIISRHRRNPLVRKLDHYFAGFHRAYENLNYDFYENGESVVIEILKNNLDIKTIFDVGSNVGEWTLMANDMFPQANTYAFEIVPETYQKLFVKCGKIENVKLFNLGLCDIQGEASVHFSSNKNSLATCVDDFLEEFHDVQPDIIKARVTTGDLFCSENDITNIDFLKIDVEGYEPQVLKGFQEMLQAGKIKVIQFEYGYVNIAVKYLLKDFYGFFEKFDMEIGKIYPTYVDFRKYHYRDENFFGPNYLVVHSSLKSLIKELRNKG